MADTQQQQPVISGGDITGILNFAANGAAGLARVLGGDKFINNWTGVTDNRNYQQSLIDQANAYNSPEAIKKRLMDAGLTEAQANRYLAGQASAAGATSVQSPGAGTDSKGAMGMLGAVFNLVNSLADTVNKNANTDNTKAETEKTEKELPYLDEFFSGRNKSQNAETSFKESSTALVDEKKQTEKMVQILHGDAHDLNFLTAQIMQQQFNIGEEEIKSIQVERVKTWKSLDKLFWETYEQRENALHARRGFQLQDAERIANIGVSRALSRYYHVSADDLEETRVARLEEIQEHANYFAQSANLAFQQGLSESKRRKQLFPQQIEAMSLDIESQRLENQFNEARNKVEGKPFAHFYKTYLNPVVHLTSELILFSAMGGTIGFGIRAVKGFRVGKSVRTAAKAAKAAKAGKTARTAAAGSAAASGSAAGAAEASQYIDRLVGSLSKKEKAQWDILVKDPQAQELYFEKYLKLGKDVGPGERSRVFADCLNEYFRKTL